MQELESAGEDNEDAATDDEGEIDATPGRI
jgi:hypothetical protein